MVVRVSLCLIHWCAPWCLCDIQHKAGVDTSSRSLLNADSLTHKSLSIENFFNGLKAMLFPFIVFLTFSNLPSADWAQASLHFNC